MAGRTLQRAKGERPLVAVCLPLLIGTDGHLKMSKSVGNSILIDETPAEMYGKLMSVPDSLIMNYFTLLTDVSGEELASIERGIEDNTLHPMEVKKRLARTIVALLHGDAAADAAQGEFERVFQRRERPVESAVEIPWASLASFMEPSIVGDLSLKQAEEVHHDGLPITLPAFIASNFEVSTSEARRQIDQGGVRIDGGQVQGRVGRVKRGSIVQLGRHKFVKIQDSNAER
jgi:tyrosyl-tRNA synthetase